MPFPCLFRLVICTSCSMRINPICFLQIALFFFSHKTQLVILGVSYIEPGVGLSNQHIFSNSAYSKILWFSLLIQLLFPSMRHEWIQFTCSVTLRGKANAMSSKRTICQSLLSEVSFIQSHPFHLEPMSQSVLSLSNPGLHSEMAIRVNTRKFDPLVAICPPFT